MEDLKREIKTLQLYTEVVMERNQLRSIVRILAIICLIEAIGLVILVLQSLAIANKLGI
jgi:hypothetical protein